MALLELDIKTRYVQLISLLSQIIVPTDTLKELILKFKDDINSVRRSDSIGSIRELIHVLETRYVLHSLKLDKLLDIVEALDVPNQLVNELQELVKLVNKYRSVCPEILPNAYGVRVQGDSLPDEVISIVIEDLDDDWDELGRALKVPEGRIEIIDRAFPSDQDNGRKAFEILKAFIEISNSKYSKRVLLLNALAATKRNDIKLKIEGILMNRR